MTKPVRLFCILLLLLTLTACIGIEKYGSADYYDHLVPEEIEVIMPPNAPYISEQFRYDGEKIHQGIDIWGKRGTPVLAAAPGKVSKSFYEPAYGHRIVIDHGLAPNGERLFTVYKHLDQRLAREGDTLARGQQIATMGDTGALGMLVHLHFETMRWSKTKGEIYYDPHLVWMDGVGRVTCFETGKRYADEPFRTTYPVRCK
ncbi:M23 family metallopeptidase [Ruegeria sp. WL0004]|uniref:M23 family metallopeptidase n=1 Tax=Ruegeria marisflavi TaxID=2984152 RepID=A0ABT2WPC0_9RHOB|nr:M23 family metallopeptidase [Ruegeria sp. WL0004]MCU9837750.1 M23 family metallopeptidase [Ruegeria sp. WL0004]